MILLFISKYICIIRIPIFFFLLQFGAVDIAVAERYCSFPMILKSDIVRLKVISVNYVTKHISINSLNVCSIHYISNLSVYCKIQIVDDETCFNCLNDTGSLS